MEDSDMKAIREIANGMEYVASEAVDKASYDVTRNARITKVYYGEGSVTNIIGYDINVDGKYYHIEKERGKGIIAKENDIVKVHYPCNSSNYMYLSYSHDPEDFIKYFNATEGPYYNIKYNSGRAEYALRFEVPLTFPATTKQFSSVLETYPLYLPMSESWGFLVGADNGVWGVAMNTGAYTYNDITIKWYNENPTTTIPVTKNVNIYIKIVGIPFN